MIILIFLPILNHLWEVFVTLPIHTSCLHLNTLSMMYDVFIVILHIFIVFFSMPMYCLTNSASNSFFDRQSISIFVNNSNFTLVFFKHACHANPGADKKWAGSRTIYFSTLISKPFKYISKQKCITLNTQMIILAKNFYFKRFPCS